MTQQSVIKFVMLPIYLNILRELFSNESKIKF